MQSSPQLLPTPTMSTPPALPRRTSARNTRLHLRPEEPPIPPRLIGSPLLDKLMSPTASPASKQLMSPKCAQEMWIDGDEFSVRKNGAPRAAAQSGQQQQHPQTAVPAARYAHQQPPVPASFAATGAKLGSPTTAKRCAMPIHTEGVVSTEFTAYHYSPRPIAT